MSLWVASATSLAHAQTPATPSPAPQAGEIKPRDPADVKPNDPAEPKQERTVFEKDATPKPTESGTAKPAAQTTPPVPAAEDKPAVVTPDGKPADTGEKPVPAKVKETQPVGGTPAPPDNQPELSAPVPPPETVIAEPPVKYFVIVFGAESVPKRPRYTHTWYTIVKATPKANWGTKYDPQGNQIEYYDLLAHTISWLPRDLNIQILTRRAECGKNFDMHTTIRYCRSNGECIAMWGPYEVNPLVAEELYDKSVKQIARLNSGAVLYKAIDPDGGSAALRVSNCIHAVTDLDGPRRRFAYDELRYFGMAASSHLVSVVAAANRLDTSVTHEWVADALDLDKYCLQRRQVAQCRRTTPAPTVPAAPTAAPPAKTAALSR